MIIEVKKDPRYRIRSQFLKTTAQKILRELKQKEETVLGIVLVGKRKAKILNQSYRRMDYIPAVLSFPYHDKLPDGKIFLGEVVICFPLARQKAIWENQEIEEALSDLLRHGIKNLVFQEE